MGMVSKSDSVPSMHPIQSLLLLLQKVLWPHTCQRPSLWSMNPPSGLRLITSIYRALSQQVWGLEARPPPSKSKTHTNYPASAVCTQGTYPQTPTLTSFFCRIAHEVGLLQGRAHSDSILELFL